MKNKIKDAFQSRKFRRGAYATVISVVVILIVILVNLIFSQLNIQFDASKQGLYTLSDTSKEFIKDLEEDVVIYYLAEAGNEDSQVTEIVEQYEKLSNNIKVEYKDPVLYPQFANQYLDDEEILQNSVIVVNEEKETSKYIKYNDMFITEIDYQTYSQSVTGIDVEGQITSAIQYVTDDNIPIIYAIEGHGERPISPVFKDNLDKANMNLESLDTISAKSIPEDASALLINGPQTDFSEDETEMIKEYLQKGGNAIILVDYKTKDLTNVSDLLNYYGLDMVDGIVLESDASHYMGQYVNYIIPDVKLHDITSNLTSNNKSIVTPIATGLEVLDTARSTITADTLLETSEESFSKVDVDSNSINKEEGDIEGPFTVGLAIQEIYNDVETNLIVFGTPELLSDSLISFDSIGNLDIFLGSVNYVSHKEDSVSIPGKQYGNERLYLSAGKAYMWGAITVLLIPIALLATGGIVVYRRRKK